MWKVACCSAMSIRRKKHSYKTQKRFNSAFCYIERKVVTENIQECAKKYLDLLEKIYTIKIENDISIDFWFTENNFYHLMGLHKIKGVEQLKINSQNTRHKIYRNILNDSRISDIIARNKHYNQIRNRVENFERLFKVLNFRESSKIIIDYDNSKTKESQLDNTKYILYDTEDYYSYFIFTLGESKNNIIYPETLFKEDSSKYISEQTLLNIISIDFTNRKINQSRKQKRRRNNLYKKQRDSSPVSK